VQQQQQWRREGDGELDNAISKKDSTSWHRGLHCSVVVVGHRHPLIVTCGTTPLTDDGDADGDLYVLVLRT